MKEMGSILIAFSKDSWKPFLSEEEALQFIQEQEEKYNDLWSLTTGTIEFNLPYIERPQGYEVQDLELTIQRLKCLK